MPPTSRLGSPFVFAPDSTPAVRYAPTVAAPLPLGVRARTAPLKLRAPSQKVSRVQVHSGESRTIVGDALGASRNCGEAGVRRRTSELALLPRWGSGAGASEWWISAGVCVAGAVRRPLVFAGDHFDQKIGQQLWRGDRATVRAPRRRSDRPRPDAAATPLC